MKQHVTKEQWDEITDEQKDKIWSSLDTEFLPNIGQMIEFLGEEWQYHLFVPEERSRGNGAELITKTYKGELCDALWEAVKINLR